MPPAFITVNVNHSIFPPSYQVSRTSGSSLARGEQKPIPTRSARNSTESAVRSRTRVSVAFLQLASISQLAT